MSAWIGRSLLVIGLIHTAFGVVFFGDALVPVIGEGVFNTIDRAAPAERGMAFWFFFAGFFLLMIGGLVDHIERAGIAMPAFLPWTLLVLTVVGSVLMPLSGFWLLFVPVVGLLLRMHVSERQR